MGNKPIKIEFNKDYKYNFSVCTLVTDELVYLEMVKSFEDANFDKNQTEFLYIDNSINNKSDAYNGLNYFLQNAKGKYIIICHQDILLKFDDRAVLESKIKEINEIDSNWAVLSNAGGLKVKSKVMRVTDLFGNTQTFGNFPSKVLSVDEHFILIKNSANLVLSNDISGFHFYGTDLCSIAKILGYSSYVIDFNLIHKSSGKLDSDFFDIKSRFIDKYSRIMPSGYVQTTCTIMYLSRNKILLKIFNSKFVLFFVRNFCSLKNKIERKYAKN